MRLAPTALLATLALALALPSCGGREDRSKPAASSLASSAPGSSRADRRVPVLFVGLDGADWQLLDRYLAAGAMPNLARLVSEGSSGILETELPALSPLLWTTMMTGVSPLEHRILDFTSFSPTTGRREPIGSDERRAPAVWNIASWTGRRVGVFGLWATFPAEEVNGILVSDRLSSFLGPRGDPPSDAVFPASLASVASATRKRLEQEVDLEYLRRFLPRLTSAEVESSKRAANPYVDPVSGLIRMIVETRLMDELYRDFVGRDSPDIAVLYIQASDTVGHLFAPYLPPRPATTSPADFERWKDVPERFFHWIDELLGAYLELAEESGAVLMLASDHGFHWDEGRPQRASSVANATAAQWHRPEGIYVLHGPGISARPRDPSPHSIRRVAATLLALSGLPSGVGMAGPPLSPVTASNVPEVDYARRFRREISQAKRALNGAGPGESPEELARLRALGYLGASEADARAKGDAAGTRSPGSFNNEGLILRSEGRGDEARAAFERAIALDPRFASAAWNLSDLLWQRGEHDHSDELLRSAYDHGLVDGEERLAERAASRLRLGREQLDTGDCAAALDQFAGAAKLAPRNPAAPAAAGLALLCLGDEDGAAQAFRRSLALDPAQPELAAAVTRLRGK